ncbi:MAG: hypothetical protein H0Z33_11240 [Bacillaceae bacterium]|nr:hypothetical protein [Bacillaceae bacterium]
MLNSVAKVIRNVKKNPGYVQINETTYSRTLLLRIYPTHVRPGFLSFLRSSEVNPDVQIRVAFHMKPARIKWNWRMKWKLQRLYRSIQEAEAKDSPEGARDEEIKAYEALQHFRNANGSGHHKVYDLWVAITITASSLEKLDEVTLDIERQLDDREMRATRLKWEQTDGIQMNQLLGSPDAEIYNNWQGRLTDDEAAAMTFPFTRGSFSDDTGMYAGHRAGDGSIVWINLADPEDEMNKNIIVQGASGEGKSTLMKAYVLGMLLLGFRVFVFDVDGEWQKLCEKVGGLWVDHTRASGKYMDAFRIPNKLDESSEDLKLQQEIRMANMARFKETNNAIHRTLSLLVGGMTPEEKNAADRAIMKTWEEAGVKEDDPDTWDHPEKKASLHLWYQLLKKEDSTAARRLTEKLWMYFEGTEKDMFAQEEELEYSQYPMIVFHVAQSTNNEVEEHAGAVKMSLALQSVWNEVKRERIQGTRYTAVVVDEGQRFLKNPLASDFVNTLATTIRKWNGLLMLATNKPSVLFTEAGGTEGGNGLWENSAIKIFFYMEESAVKINAMHAEIPETIIQEIGRMHKQRTFLIRYGDRGWDKLKLYLPDQEREMYKTRGLRKAD